MRAVIYWYLISLQVPRTHPVELQRERQLGDNNGHAIQSLSSLHVAEWNSSSPFYCYDVFNKKNTSSWISPNNRFIYFSQQPSCMMFYKSIYCVNWHLETLILICTYSIFYNFFCKCWKWCLFTYNIYVQRKCNFLSL